MSWFLRSAGPRQPNVIARMWTAMIAAAPVRLWAQVLGFGTVIGVIVHTLHMIFLAINAAGTSNEIRIILANGAVGIGYALCFIALAEVVAITELKVGFAANSTGVHGELERDDPSPTTAHVEGTVTVTPETGK